MGTTSASQRERGGWKRLLSVGWRLYRPPYPADQSILREERGKDTDEPFKTPKKMCATQSMECIQIYQKYHKSSSFKVTDFYFSPPLYSPFNVTLSELIYLFI